MNIKQVLPLSSETQKEALQKLSFIFLPTGEQLSAAQLLSKIAHHPLLLAALAVSSPEIIVDVPLGFVKLDGKKVLDYYPLLNLQEDGTLLGDYPEYGAILHADKEPTVSFIDILTRKDLTPVKDTESHEALYQAVSHALFVQTMMKAVTGSDTDLVRDGQATKGSYQEAFVIDEETGVFTFHRDQYWRNGEGQEGFYAKGSIVPFTPSVADGLIFFDTAEELNDIFHNKDEKDEMLDPIPEPRRLKKVSELKSELKDVMHSLNGGVFFNLNK